MIEEGDGRVLRLVGDHQIYCRICRLDVNLKVTT